MVSVDITKEGLKVGVVVSVDITKEGLKVGVWYQLI